MDLDRRRIDRAKSHLFSCLINNPGHGKARELLVDIGLNEAEQAMVGDFRRLDSYRRAATLTAVDPDRRNVEFREFLATCRDRRGLQVGVRGHKIAAHWVTLDRYDPSPLIDCHDDIQCMHFADGTFDAIVCNAILEHVPDPLAAIAEMHRVLKRGGRIWVEVPFNQPYHPSPSDFWRVTPDGIRYWLSAFQEVDCGLFLIGGSSVYNAVFFHGLKKESPETAIP